MSTTIFDPGELLRAGLQAWWSNQSTLVPLGDPALAADDGSPASSPSSGTHCVVRIGDSSRIAFTNQMEQHDVPVTFEVFGGAADLAAAAAKPLHKLLKQMAASPSYLPALTEGGLSHVKMMRFRRRQLSTVRWRVSTEAVFRVQVGRKPT